MRVYYNANDLEDYAATIGAKVVWGRAYCAHGFSREETCIDCENGYSTDGHEYINPRGDIATNADGTPLTGSTDDGYDGNYIPARFQNKVNRQPFMPRY